MQKISRQTRSFFQFENTFSYYAHQKNDGSISYEITLASLLAD